MSAFSRFWAQTFNLPKPTLTEENLPDQSGRVIIVTGGYAGVGYELVKILYQRNATVYVAGRSKGKAAERIGALRAAIPNSKGKVEFLALDLGDLSSIKGSVEMFLSKEERLDVLVNNAGVMDSPVTAKTTQGHELQLGTNCLGPYLFTKLLVPILQKTAASSPPGSVRVTWAGSLGIDVRSPPHGGVDQDSEGNTVPNLKNTSLNYGMSKVGNLFLASQFATRYPLDAEGWGVVSNAFNPGNLRTELQRHSSGFVMWIIDVFLLYPPHLGGYTELYAGWAEAMGRQEMSGAYVIPWGRVSDVRADVQREVDVGKRGEGKAVRFWEWCERETKGLQ